MEYRTKRSVLQNKEETTDKTLGKKRGQYTHDMVAETGMCNVSVISNEADFALFKHFGFQSGRDVDKFAEYPAESYGTAKKVPVTVNTACLHTYHHTIMNSEPTGSHGWHTGFCCVYMVLVVGFGDKANGQRGSIQENTEIESMG